jgi:membrane protein YqaA with SNARE-associated domain
MDGSEIYSLSLDGTIFKASGQGNVFEKMQVIMGVFFTAFLAASFLPVASEPVVLAALTLSPEPWSLIIAAASIGNVLGAILNWWLGRLASNAAYAGWLPVGQTALKKAENWYGRWGRASLLLSWAPVIGDALTCAAGVMREPLTSFVILVAIAKTGRYVALAASVSAFGSAT